MLGHTCETNRIREIMLPKITESFLIEYICLLKEIFLKYLLQLLLGKISSKNQNL